MKYFGKYEGVSDTVDGRNPARACGLRIMINIL